MNTDQENKLFEHMRKLQKHYEAEEGAPVALSFDIWLEQAQKIDPEYTNIALLHDFLIWLGKPKYALEAQSTPKGKITCKGSGNKWYRFISAQQHRQ